MRPYEEGEDMSDVSVTEGVIPEAGGMIAVSAIDESDKWYITEDFFKENYEVVS